METMFEPDRSIHDKPRPNVKVCQNKYSRQSKLVHSGFGASWINVASPPFTRSSRPDVTRYRWSGSAAIVRDGNDTADQTAGTPSAHSIMTRSEERRVGQECVGKCRHRWQQNH